jgi:hypothetical protein
MKKFKQKHKLDKRTKEALDTIQFLLDDLSDCFKESIATRVIVSDLGDSSTPICDIGALWLLEKRDELENVKTRVAEII